jgi:hypothetical protein
MNVTSGKHACSGLVLVLVAAVALVACNRSSDSVAAREGCTIGGKPALELPRAPVRGMNGRQPPPRVVGCFQTPQGRSEMVVYQMQGSSCFSSDFPALGRSLGGACVPFDGARGRVCRSACVTNVGKVGLPASTVVLGEAMPPLSRLAVTGALKGGGEETVVARLGYPRSGRHQGVKVVFFVAVFAECVRASSIRVEANKGSAAAAVDLPISQRC